MSPRRPCTPSTAALVESVARLERVLEDAEYAETHAGAQAAVRAARRLFDGLLPLVWEIADKNARGAAADRLREDDVWHARSV